jgi:hypothetical protein
MLFCVMCVICVLYLIVVALPLGKIPFVVKINNNNVWMDTGLSNLDGYRTAKLGWIQDCQTWMDTGLSNS